MLLGVALWAAGERGLADEPRLVRDIHAGTASSNVYAVLGELDGALLLALADGAHGSELWATDGTAAGTYLVKDIREGTESSSPHAGVVAGGQLFFVAYDEVHGRELWSSDGTAAGTRIVADLKPGEAGSDPRDLVALGSRVLFAADDGARGVELWSSDGTEAGTTLVRDIEPGAAGSDPAELLPVGGAVLFAAGREDLGVELWSSDGTEAGTRPVRDILPGAGSSGPEQLVSSGPVLFFTARGQGSGREIWRSDGTEAGTGIVRDLVPGAGSLGAYLLESVGGSLLFAVTGPYYQLDLWRTDGTEAGTVEVAPLADSILSPQEPTVVGDLLFFKLVPDCESSEFELWRTDGTSDGTFSVGRFPQYRACYHLSDHWLTSFEGELYFSADDGLFDTELWKSDGTIGGTRLVADIFPGPVGSQPRHLTVFDDRLVFQALDSFHGHELWQSDGTSRGTELLVDVALSSGSSYPRRLAALGSEVCFAATDGLRGHEVWRSDATVDGTRLVGETIPGPEPLPMLYSGIVYGPITGVQPVGDRVFFRQERELWVTDGSGAQARRVPLDPGFATAYAMTSFDGDLLLASLERSNNGRLWRTDGTAAGTRLLADTYMIRQPYTQEPLVRWRDLLYFRVWDGGNQLWRTDGTPEGTVPVYQARYPRSLGPDLVGWGEELYFAAEGADRELLLATDGTTSGTRVVARLDEQIGEMAATDAAIFFAVGGTELWTSDGTSAGTVRVARLPLRDDSSDWIRELTAAGDQVYFRAGDESSGEELWVSDGTPAGTRQVMDILPGPESSRPLLLTAFDGALFFTAEDGLHGRELWVTKGTHAGARMVADLRAGPLGSRPSQLTPADGILYFSADDGTWGDELWSIVTRPAVSALHHAFEEGDSGARPVALGVELSHPSGQEVRVSYATRAGTAAAGEDFGPASGTVAVPPGALSAAIEVELFGDTEVEEDETFDLVLATPINARLGRAEARISIWNDDYPQGACGLADVIELRGRTLTASRSYAACTAIYATDVRLSGSVSLELRAGDRVRLGDGFAATAGSALAVEAGGAAALATPGVSP